MSSHISSPKNNNSQYISHIHYISDAVIGMSTLISPNDPDRELLLLSLLQNMLRDIKPSAKLHVLTYPHAVCVLEALESQEDAGRAENWLAL